MSPIPGWASDSPSFAHRCAWNPGHSPGLPVHPVIDAELPQPLGGPADKPRC